MLRSVGIKSWHQTYPTVQMADSLPRTDTREQFAGANLFEAVPSQYRVKAFTLIAKEYSVCSGPKQPECADFPLPMVCPVHPTLFYLFGLCSHTLQCRSSTESKRFAARTASEHSALSSMRVFLFRACRS